MGDKIERTLDPGASDQTRLRRRQWKSFNLERSLTFTHEPGTTGISSPGTAGTNHQTSPATNHQTQQGGGSEGPTSRLAEFRSPGSRVSRLNVRKEGGGGGEASTEDTSDSDLKEFIPQYGQVVPELRGKLANQGCSQSQLYLARELLIQAADIDVDKEEQSLLEERAVYWLIKASERGHQEARTTLLSMYGEGRGVNLVNYPDIAAIHALPSKALLGSDIGKQLFISTANGSSYITPAQLAALPEDEEYEYPSRVRFTGDAGKLTLPQTVEAVCQYLQGELPTINNKVQEFRRRRWYSSSRLILLAIVLLLSALNLLHYSNFNAQTTLQQLAFLSVIFLIKIRLIDRSQYRFWSTIFRKFSSAASNDGFEDAAAAATKYEKILVERVEVAPAFWFLFFTSYLEIQDLSSNKVSQLILISSLALLLVLVCVESRKCLILLPCYVAALIYQTRIQYSLENFVFPDVVGGEWVYRLLVSMMVVAAAKFSGSTVVLLLCVVLYPITFLASNYVLQSYEDVYDMVTEDTNLYCIVASAALPQLYLAFKNKKHRLLAIILLLVRSSTLIPEEPRSVSALSWLEFQAACVKPSSISVSATCDHLTGVGVEWRGEVVDVKVLHKQNIPDTFVSYLPRRVGGWIVCWLGDPYATCHAKSSEAARLLCRHKAASSDPLHKCHLEKFSRYTYGVRVRMDTNLFGGSSQGLLRVAHSHSHQVRSIEPGSSLLFTGTLASSLTTDSPNNFNIDVSNLVIA